MLTAWAEAGVDQEERARTQTTEDAVKRQRLWADALIAVHEGGGDNEMQSRAGGGASRSGGRSRWREVRQVDCRQRRGSGCCRLLGPRPETNTIEELSDRDRGFLHSILVGIRHMKSPSIV